MHSSCATCPRPTSDSAALPPTPRGWRCRSGCNRRSSLPEVTSVGAGHSNRKVLPTSTRGVMHGDVPTLRRHLGRRTHQKVRVSLPDHADASIVISELARRAEIFQVGASLGVARVERQHAGIGLAPVDPAPSPVHRRPPVLVLRQALVAAAAASCSGSRDQHRRRSRGPSSSRRSAGCTSPGPMRACSTSSAQS